VLVEAEVEAADLPPQAEVRLEPTPVVVMEGDVALEGDAALEADAALEEDAAGGVDLAVVVQPVVAGAVGVPDSKTLQAGLHQNVNHNVPIEYDPMFSLID
jgi:hypothetical protein